MLLSVQVLAAPGVSPAPEGVGAAPPGAVVCGGVEGAGTAEGGVTAGVGAFTFGGGVWAETQGKRGKNTRASNNDRGDISVHRRGIRIWPEIHEHTMEIGKCKVFRSLFLIQSTKGLAHHASRRLLPEESHLSEIWKSQAARLLRGGCWRGVWAG